MLNLNSSTLQAVADKALVDAAAHRRWIAAISRALDELETNPFVERQADGHGIIIGSTSGRCYAANGTCSCTAFLHGQPCYHRAMARIVRLHDEMQEASAPSEESAFASLARRIAAAREATRLMNECL